MAHFLAPARRANALTPHILMAGKPVEAMERLAFGGSLFDHSDALEPNQVDEQAGRSSQFRETGCPPGALRADRVDVAATETTCGACGLDWDYFAYDLVHSFFCLFSAYPPNR